MDKIKEILPEEGQGHVLNVYDSQFIRKGQYFSNVVYGEFQLDGVHELQDGETSSGGVLLECNGYRLAEWIVTESFA